MADQQSAAFSTTLSLQQESSVINLLCSCLGRLLAAVSTWLKWALSYSIVAHYVGLYAWRDRIARDRDERTGFVMPKLLLMKLVKGIPKTTQELLKHLGK